MTLPKLAYSKECWITATTFNSEDDPVAVATAAYHGEDITSPPDRLCVRISSLMEVSDYPEVVEYIEHHGLQPVEQFEEQDDFVVGHAIVTVYGLSAVPELVAA